MPGFDGTGPRGMGPMTGGGRGWCNPYWTGGAPAVRGAGFVPWGGGRGRGYRWMYYATGLPGWMRFGGYAGAPVSPASELDVLRAQAEALGKHLEAINARIVELEKASSEPTP
ncbi:MAG: DUF5320 domain-containing protein [Armatimonadota bacterium]|nr:DUF5320 domain-containing protein [Armatimonadota bacterium]